MAQRTTSIFCAGQTASLPRRQLMMSCDIFEANPALLTQGYRARSPVSAAIFQLFVDAIRGSDPELSRENAPGLKLLCDEFQFTDLGAKVQVFLIQWPSFTFGMQTIYIARSPLLQKCGRFREDESLLTRPYHVQSPVSTAILQLFVDSIEGASPEISLDNAHSLKLLCDEFQFSDLGAKVYVFLSQWVSIVFGGQTKHIPRGKVAQRCSLFRDVQTAPYYVLSPVSAANLQLFIDAIEGTDLEISHDNAPDLKLLCDEFQFIDLGAKVQAFIDRWTSLVLKEETLHVPRDKLVQKCSLFRDGRSPVTQPYKVSSSVPVHVFRMFVSAIDDICPNLTNGNVIEIKALCDEFGYAELSARVAEFLVQHSSASDYDRRYCVLLEAQNAEIAALREQMAAFQDLERRIVDLEQHNADLEERLARLEPDPYS
jgi:hypothetical protein